MSKVKFSFNTKSLKYEKVEPNFRDRIVRLVWFLATGLVFASITMVFAYSYFSSPKEKRLQRELDEMHLQYDYLNKRLDQISEVMGGMQDRDDNIYRVIFEAEPIPDDVRKAGVGGTNKYEKLEGFESSELLIGTAKRFD